MFGKNGEKWFTVIFCGCFLLIGTVFTGVAIAFLFSSTAEARIMTAVFGFIGVLFVVIGSTFLVVQGRKKRIAAKVRAEGRRYP